MVGKTIKLFWDNLIQCTCSDNENVNKISTVWFTNLFEQLNSLIAFVVIITEDINCQCSNSPFNMNQFTGNYEGRIY